MEEDRKEIDQEGLETPSGISSIASGLETPDTIELRKDVRRFFYLYLNFTISFL